jgi:hypothetical protein
MRVPPLQRIVRLPEKGQAPRDPLEGIEMPRQKAFEGLQTGGAESLLQQQSVVQQ